MKFSDYLLRVPGVKQIISALGIDKAIFYTALNIVWGSLAGIISIFFIVTYLSLSEQGYWYTFLSLGALATFAELGFTMIITQFISHEYAHLNEENGKLIGHDQRVDRTISLIKFSFKFYLIIASTAFIILSVVGVIFLMDSTKDLNILMSWVFYSFTGAFLLLVSLFGAVLKGFNKVEKTQKIVMVASFVSNIATWSALFAGFSLWALAIGGLTNIILSIWLFFSSSNKLWMQIFRFKVVGQYNWLKETLPLQWRYAVSWVSGYFIFQFIVPVAMFYAGADIAGKVGLSFVIARAVQSLANSWGFTKVPEFNMLVAHNNRAKLDYMIQTIQKQSLFIYVLGSITLILILTFIFPIINWDSRVLPTYEIALILIAEGITVIIVNWAYYLRSNKQEPYMKISVLSAILTAIGVWISYSIFSSTLLAICSYLAAQLIILLPAKRVLNKKRKEYENGVIGYK